MAAESFSYDPEALDKSIKSVMDSEIEGVKGLKEFKGEVAGPSDPTLYLGTFTHGNERMSAAALPALLGSNIRLLRGRVIAGVNNLEAAQLGMRRIKDDFDFNRLPEDNVLSEAHKDNPSVAIQRLRSLARAAFGKVTHGLDNHTVPHSPFTAMKLNEKGPDSFANSIGIPTYITRITEFQYDPRNPDGPRTVAFGNYVGGLENGLPVAEIEGGGPESPEVYDSVLRGTLSVMAQLGMIDPEAYGLEKRMIEQKKYEVSKWAWAPEGYRLVRAFEPYAQVTSGERIMEDTSDQGRADIVAPFDGHLIMQPPYATSAGERYVLDGPDDWWYSKPAVTENVEVL